MGSFSTAIGVPVIILAAAAANLCFVLVRRATLPKLGLTPRERDVILSARAVGAG